MKSHPTRRGGTVSPSQTLPRLRRRFNLAVVLVSLCASGIAQAAEPLTGRERRIVQSVEVTLRKAAAAYSAQKYADSNQEIGRVIRQINTAMNLDSPALYDALAPSMKRVTTAQALLELEGMSVSPFRKPDRPAPKAAVTAEEPPASMSPTGTPASARPGLSFVRDVAPILNNRCGRCHLDSPKGGFSFTTFASLMRGTAAGVVVFPGDPLASRLIETIETGDMPRGGGRVEAAELKTLKDWILAGAKYDGPDPRIPTPRSLDFFPVAADAPEPAGPTGRETVSFAADVAGLFVEACADCHVNAMQIRGGLNMNTFAQLLRGGDSGPIVRPGNSAESLLVQKLRGLSGDRMPAGGRPAFTEDQIRLVATWIDEGAKLDAGGPDQSLDMMSKLAWVAAATDAEVTAKRLAIAEKNIGLFATDAQVIERVSAEHFEVIGTASEATLKLVAEIAEDQMDDARRVVNAAPGEAYFGGKTVIYVTPRRYDYSEFAKMVERRQVPADWRSHWSFDGIDAYIAMVATERDEPDEIARRLTAPVISMAVATRNASIPRWIAQGVGGAIAARTAPPDRNSKMKRNADTRQAIAAIQETTDFLGGGLTPTQTDLVAAAVAKTMLGRKQLRLFNQLIENLSQGGPFEPTFVATYGISPQQFIEQWLQSIPRN